MALRAKRKNMRPDEYLNGVPNGDLDEETYQALEVDQRKTVRESGLWDVKTDAEMGGTREATPARTAGSQEGSPSSA
jgi:hypothetical protein